MSRISNAAPFTATRSTFEVMSTSPAVNAVAKPQVATTMHARFDAAYWSRLEDLAGRPAAQATDVVFLREHEPAWDDRISLIQNSRSAIWGSLYIVNADDRAFALFEALIDARRRGIDVCVAIDSIAHLGTSFGDKRADRKKLDGLIETLRAEGGVVTWAGTLDDQLRKPGAGVHFKSLVSDNRVAIVGGRNISEEYFGDWTDFDTRLEGPIVQQIGRATLDLLRSTDATPVPFQRDARLDGQADRVQDRIEALLSKPPPHGGAAPNRPPVEFQLLTFDPLVDGADGSQNVITEALKETIDRAQKEIVLTSNFVTPAFDLRESLIAAAERGVRVKLVTSGPEAVSPLAHKAVALTYADLLAAGCEIWETSDHEHGKMYVVDGQVGAYGSYNASIISDARNAEGLLFTSDKRVVSELRHAVEDTLSRSERYTGAPNRFAAWVLDLAGRIFN
ncbi:MAG: phosphatidylserine/phosphatidylglycerophosphate/cardiolipin synthase family protein [Myxococcaceae bacterium]